MKSQGLFTARFQQKNAERQKKTSFNYIGFLLKEVSVALFFWVRYPLLSLCLIMMGVLIGRQESMENSVPFEVFSSWNDALTQQKNLISVTRNAAETEFSQITLRMAEVQAKMIRLEALAARLTTLAGVSRAEFNFSNPPPIGGPDESEEVNYSKPSFLQELASLSHELNEREFKLEALKQMIAKNKLSDEVFLSTNPTGGAGWISSPYGLRRDPFTGRSIFHHGIDIAGAAGSSIYAADSGVVTFSGRRAGYGLMIEIQHGDGYATRYAHCRQLLVRKGDAVHKEQVIAKLGSTGRSTGTHVHYEVLKNGVHLNPAKYLSRAKG